MSGLLSHDFHRPVVIAMVAVYVVQATVHQVVGVIAVGHGGVAAVGPVYVGLIVPGSGLHALVGVGLADWNEVVGDFPALLVLQMSVVEVIHMPLMTHGNVTTSRSMLMRLARLSG
jgi:hypothetical protein